MEECSSIEKARAVARQSIKQRGTWLGEDYDVTRKTVAISDKTREKIKACWREADDWTWRTYAGHMALLFYASRTLGIRLGQYYGALRAYAAAGWLLTERPELWDQRMIPLQQHAKDSIEQWTNDVLTHGPREIPRDLRPSWLIVSDASHWGWGAWVMKPNGKITWHSHKWSSADRHAGLSSKTSAHAEPEAIARVLDTELLPTTTSKVLILTDSTTAKYALQKGYSPSFFVNAIATRVALKFPSVQLQLEHLPGACNMADGVSRGKKPTVDDWESFRVLASDDFYLEEDDDRCT